MGEHSHEIPPYVGQTGESGIALAITLATEKLSAAARLTAHRDLCGVEQAECDMPLGC